MKLEQAIRIPEQENSTDKIDRVVMRDLEFWLPYTKSHLPEGIPHAATFEALSKLPIAQIGFTLGVLIKIIRRESNLRPN